MSIKPSKMAVFLSPLVLAVAALALSGCMSSGAGQESVKNLTTESFQQKVIKGRSTKSDVKRELGEPGSTYTDNGLDHWVYYYGSVKGSALNMIPFVGMLVNHTESSNKTWTVTFNKRGVVQDIDTSNANGSYNGGLLQ